MQNEVNETSRGDVTIKEHQLLGDLVIDEKYLAECELIAKTLKDRTDLYSLDNIKKIISPILMIISSDANFCGSGIFSHLHDVLLFLINNERLNQDSFNAVCLDAYDKNKCYSFIDYYVFCDLNKFLNTLDRLDLLSVNNLDNALQIFNANRNNFHQINNDIENIIGMIMDSPGALDIALAHYKLCIDQRYSLCSQNVVKLYQTLEELGLSCYKGLIITNLKHLPYVKIRDANYYQEINEHSDIELKDIFDFYFNNIQVISQCENVLEILHHKNLLNNENFSNVKHNVFYIESIYQAFYWLTSGNNSDDKFNPCLTQEIFDMVMSKPSAALLVAWQHGGRPNKHLSINASGIGVHNTVYSTVEVYSHQFANDYINAWKIAYFLTLGHYDTKSQFFNMSFHLLNMIISFCSGMAQITVPSNTKKLDTNSMYVIGEAALAVYNNIYSRKFLNCTEPMTFSDVPPEQDGAMYEGSSSLPAP